MKLWDIVTQQIVSGRSLARSKGVVLKPFISGNHKLHTSPPARPDGGLILPKMFYCRRMNETTTKTVIVFILDGISENT